MRKAAASLFLLLALAFAALAQDHAAPAGEHKSPAAEHADPAHAAKGEEHGGSHAAADDVTKWKWANFAILAVVLGYIVAKQAGPFFAARSIEIRKGIEDSTRLRQEADANAAAMEARLANLGREVEAMRAAAKDEAAREGARIREETQRDLAKVQSQAAQEIASALKAAQVELKTYSARLAIDLAREKVRQRITPADRDALVQHFVADLEARLEPR